MSIDTWLLIAIAAMVYVIGYGLTVAAVVALAKQARDRTPPSDFVVSLLWPVLVPIILLSAPSAIRKG